MNQTITWSGAACSFVGAGAYIGISPCDEHYSLAARILPRRGRVYAGRATRLQMVETIPTVYFAVRDPSAVRIVPVRDRRNRGHRHVILNFEPRPDRAPPHHVDVLTLLRRHCDERHRGVFIVTVGLAPEHEDRFFTSVVLATDGREYKDLCSDVQGFRLGRG